jgi:plasmid stabilization system protein ParE
MTRQFVLRKRAHDDLRTAYRWYESQRSGLGEEFLRAVGEKFEAIRQFPEANPIIYLQVRRAVVSRFPYLVFYVLKPNRVDVLAVLHYARSPERWPSR